MKITGEDKELQSIKMQYLGLNREKKKMLRPSEKFKNIFNFEWDDNEGHFLIKIMNFYDNYYNRHFLCHKPSLSE